MHSLIDAHVQPQIIAADLFSLHLLVEIVHCSWAVDYIILQKGHWLHGPWSFFLIIIMDEQWHERKGT
jgi:hypothetical protein